MLWLPPVSSSGASAQALLEALAGAEALEKDTPEPRRTRENVGDRKETKFEKS